MDVDLHHIINQVPGWANQDFRANTLKGGITNQNYRVDIGGHAYVLRICDKQASLLGIKRDHEYACTQIVAQLGFAPEIVHYLPEKGIFVSKFIEGKALNPENMQKPETLQKFADLIRCYHSGPTFPGLFSAFDTVRNYYNLAQKAKVSFPKELPKVLNRMAMIEEAVSVFDDKAPCHNDLLIRNFIDDGQKLWILDWEYAAMGDPYFDLGNFAVNQELGDREKEQLLLCYAGEVNEVAFARLNLMMLASDLRESFWGLLQSGISKLDFDFKDYVDKLLDRFLTHATKPTFILWLDVIAKHKRSL